MKAASLSGSKPSLWILNPTWDMLLFILAPVWIIPVIWCLKDRTDLNSIGTIILALGATGHHMPGLIRAYTDPQLFRRYRWRFILSPIFFISVCMAFAYLDLHGLFLIVVIWGSWHGAMQVNGFLRIYDSKVGSVSRATAKLDWAMCLAWFGGAILYSPVKLTAIFAFFYQSGGTLISPQGFFLFRDAWVLLTVGITMAFAANAWQQARRGLPSSPLKFLLMASTFGFWWFSIVMINNVLLSVLLFEIFHDLQYSALVWVYNEGRVAKNMAASSVERFIFRPGWRIVLFAALILAYGYFGIASGYATTTMPRLLGGGESSRYLVHFIIASTFLHFYFDGFIWRVRESGFRKDLGIKDIAGNAVRQHHFSWKPAVLKWALFVIPAIFFGLTEYYHHPLLAGPQFQTMLQFSPNEWHLNFIVAEAMGSDEAHSLAYLQKVVAIQPDFAPAQKMLGEIFDRRGLSDSALVHYQLAVNSNPLDGESLDSLESIRKRISMDLLRKSS